MLFSFLLLSNPLSLCCLFPPPFFFPLSVLPGKFTASLHPFLFKNPPLSFHFIQPIHYFLFYSATLISLTLLLLCRGFPFSDKFNSSFLFIFIPLLPQFNALYPSLVAVGPKMFRSFSFCHIFSPSSIPVFSVFSSSTVCSVLLPSFR